jgi:hypothetical protein
VGNWRGQSLGTFFIELAKNDMRQWKINLPETHWPTAI